MEEARDDGVARDEWSSYRSIKKARDEIRKLEM